MAYSVQDLCGMEVVFCLYPVLLLYFPKLETSTQEPRRFVQNLLFVLASNAMGLSES